MIGVEGVLFGVGENDIGLIVANQLGQLAFALGRKQQRIIAPVKGPELGPNNGSGLLGLLVAYALHVRF